ncbi:hypothetical protein GOP47_0004893 [Adiantum capillus-veneris]|uniref:PPM-type phosphatase domain-containing protein n=1 Tax=Adiantum capillus-veneris TaxID=13818 RepID=A0A9D4V4J2_ADICA|nr:hypothetical protein GOP47_0004893 [Adiantum capillus-veneris]
MGACLSVDDSSDDEVGCGGSARAKRKQRKQRIMEVLAAEAKNNELLFRMPGRMCLNGSSSNACIFTQQGRKGTNQDAMIVWESFASRADTTFCGVFDGHGPYGHLVARKVRDSLPSKLAAIYKTQARQEMRMIPSANGIDEVKALNYTGVALDVNAHGTVADGPKKVFSSWKDCFLKAYHAMDKELKSHPTIDCFCSGTTSVTMVLQGQDIVIANVGDSRAVLATLIEDDNTQVEAIQLTVDLKPNLPLEAERIKRCKGRVFALEDEPEVARVWLPHDDSPGLAMARAFGDFCLKDFGLIAVPEVTYTRLTERDQFIVLASDGVWDVLSNKEVVETIWEAPTRTTAARSLVETAVRAWRLKYPTSKVDDCAVVCFYFNKQQRWQAQATVSACSAVELGEVPKMDVEEAMAPPEFNRSNTLRTSSSGKGVNDRHSVVEQSLVSQPHGDIAIEEGVSIGKSSISEQMDAGADDKNGGLSVDAVHTNVNLVDAKPEDNNHHCEAIAETQHVNSPFSRSPSPQERSEIFETLLPTVQEEAPSEITVMSDVGEDEVGKIEGNVAMGRSSSRRSLAECLSVADEDEWSALEGVARVNSLMNLPRFLGGDKRMGSPSFRAAKSSKSKKGVGKNAAPAAKRRW